MSTRILVPVNGSDASQRAAALAGTLARALNAKLCLLYVFDAPSGGLLGLEGHAAQHLDKARQQLAADALDQAEAQLGGHAATRHIETGKPAEVILEFAAVEGIDHIVMGGGGHSALQEILAGSVCERVLQRAPCPVTIVR